MNKTKHPFNIGVPIIALLKKKMYTGFFLARLKKVAVRNDPEMTAAVTYINYQMHLLYSPEFLGKLRPSDQISAMEHEAFHIIFGHVYEDMGALRRAWPDITMDALGIAMDLSVNSYISFSPKFAGKLHFPRLYGLPSRKTWRFYLSIILKRVRKVKEKKKNEKDLKKKEEKPLTPEQQKERWDNMSADERLTSMAEGLIQQSSVQEHFDKLMRSMHHAWQKGGDKKGGFSKEERDAMKCIVDTMTIGAMEDTKRSQGNFPYGVYEMLEGLLKKKVIPWNKYLIDHMSSSIVQVWEPMYSCMNHRYKTFPGKRRLTQAKAVVVFDNSFSISNKDWNEFWSEVNAIYKILNIDLDVIQCDAVINGHTKYRKGVIPVRTGKGGTDLRPPFDYIRDKKLNPNIVIYFTDGCGPAPEKAPKNYVTIWVYPSANEYTREQSWGHQLYITPE